MLLVYSSKITNRTLYIIEFIFNKIIGLSARLTDSMEEFNTYEGPKLNYSQHPIENELFIYASGLLFEHQIKVFEAPVGESDGTPVLFPVHDPQSCLTFDIFSASFFLISRYEEYLPSIKDRLGRFDPKGSVAYKNGFLQKPMVNVWAQMLKDILKWKYPNLIFRSSKFVHIPTIDIDLAWVYKNKGLIRTLGGLYKSMAKRNFKEIASRLKVIFNKEIDPFDSYDYILAKQKEYDFDPIFFFLLADYAELDKNTPVNNSEFQSLIKKISDYALVGIHPSYASNTEPSKVGIEISRLSEILNKEITDSRQHFLTLNLPYTYKNLITFGVLNDYSMGYPSEIGFRASTCTPFPFFDMEMDKPTQLIIHPIAFMDGTLKDYYQIEATSAISYIKPLYELCQSLNGTFISLWHNESLSETGRWQGWRAVFEETLLFAQ